MYFNTDSLMLYTPTTKHATCFHGKSFESLFSNWDIIDNRFYFTTYKQPPVDIMHATLNVNEIHFNEIMFRNHTLLAAFRELQI